MKNIKKIILVVIIILFVILAVILSTIIVVKENISNNNESQLNEPIENTVYNDVQNDGNNVISNIIEDEEVEKIPYGSTIEVTNQTYFYTVQNCIESFIEDAQYLQQENIEENREIVYNQLSKTYIEKNNIELNNVEKYININEDVFFIATVKMFQFQVENNNVIRFSTRVLYSNENDIEYMNFIVYLDYWNMTYSVEPISSDITDISQVNLNGNIDAIQQNENNNFTYEVTTTDKLVDNYFSSFTDMCFLVPEIAYEYLNEEYKNETFSNIEEFKEYIFTNQNKLEDITIEQYSIVDDNGTTRYICVDQYGLSYIIDEVAIMQFKITLDYEL